MGIYSSNFVVFILATLASSASCFFLIYFYFFDVKYYTYKHNKEKNSSNKLVNTVN